MPFIVAMTRPNCEAMAAFNLERQGYEPYLPRTLEKRPNKPPRIRPLFPRYIIIKIQSTWYSVRGTRGISHVLMSDNGPCLIVESIVTDLKAREDKKGLVQLAPKPKFLNGTAVKTKTGPFAGFPMLYDGMTSHDRAKVLVELLGRSVPIELEEKQLIAA